MKYMSVNRSSKKTGIGKEEDIINVGSKAQDTKRHK